MTLPKPFMRMRLQTKIILLVWAVVALALLVTNVLMSANVAAGTQKALEEKVIDIARIIARTPLIGEALAGQRDEGDIQEFVNQIRETTQIEFIVVMDMHGIRKSHLDPSKIGQQFVGGDEKPVLSGREYISLASGTLGRSLRAFTPVFLADGRQVGAVAAGILLNDVHHAVARNRALIYQTIIYGLVIGVIGGILLAKNIKKTLFGLEPFAIARLLEEHNAMLLSVREGIIAIDKNARITLINHEAGRLLEQADRAGEWVGHDITACIPNTCLTKVLQTGCTERDLEQDLNGMIVLTNCSPVRIAGEIVGAIATFRDKTEIQQLAEELTGVRHYAESLRAHTHEFMNKLHVILGMVRLQCYDELMGYIKEIARQYQADVGGVVRCIKDPVLAGFFLNKISHARELGVDLFLAEDSFLPEPANSEIVHELVTVIGNLVDNALEAVAQVMLKRVDVAFCYDRGHLQVRVSDSGTGLTEEQIGTIFTKGYSTKADKRGLGLYLVARSLERINGKIDVYSQVSQGTTFGITLPYPIKGEAG